MERFFLHLHECGSLVRDTDGIDYASLNAARQAAIDGGRDVMAEEVRQGRLCLSSYIEIENGDHQIVARISFRDMLTVTDTGNYPA